jgi:hypothetical protein
MRRPYRGVECFEIPGRRGIAAIGDPARMPEGGKVRPDRLPERIEGPLAGQCKECEHRRAKDAADYRDHTYAAGRQPNATRQHFHAQLRSNATRTERSETYPHNPCRSLNATYIAPEINISAA